MNKPIVLENPRSRDANYMKLVTRQAQDKVKLPILLILSHIPLGILLYNLGILALLHPIIAFGIGMRHALVAEEKLERAAQMAAYIVGAEILWRMAGVPIFWEFGKYGAAFIMIAALVRRGLWKIPAFAVFYFVLLLPSCFITLTQQSFSSARQMISFNLSGPFFLLISAWFFSHLKLTHPEIRKLLLSLIVPLMSVAITTLFYTVTAPEIEFNGESNFATSGGFGPNQVSAMLGLGLFLCVACFLLFKNTLHYSIYFGALAVLFLAQGMLTFSRGGIYNAVGGILAIVFIQMRNFKEGIRRFLPIVGIAVVFLILIFPYLNDFTGGALQERFEDQEATGRFQIVEADANIFAENPILGVGVGNAYEARGKFLFPHKAVSHTEFSRLVAEHGIFGIFSMGALAFMVIFNFRRQTSDFGKALTIGLIVWSGLFMLNAGMRLAAPSIIIGMIYLTVVHTRTQIPKGWRPERS
jgi:O-antigen ligase